MKLKLKKSLKLISLATLGVAATVTPIVTMTACGNDAVTSSSSAESGIPTAPKVSIPVTSRPVPTKPTPSKPVPSKPTPSRPVPTKPSKPTQPTPKPPVMPVNPFDDEGEQPTLLNEKAIAKNYTEAEFEDAVNDFKDKYYHNRWSHVSVDTLMSQLTDKLKVINQKAYQGFDTLATYNQANKTWTLKPCVTYLMIYEFFESRVSSHLFPSSAAFDQFFKLNNLENNITQKINMLMNWYAYAISALDMTKLFYAAGMEINLIPTIPSPVSRASVQTNFQKQVIGSRLYACTWEVIARYAEFVYAWKDIPTVSSWLYDASATDSPYKPLTSFATLATNIVKQHDFINSFIASFMKDSLHRNLVSIYRPNSHVDAHGYIAFYYPDAFKPRG